MKSGNSSTPAVARSKVRACTLARLTKTNMLFRSEASNQTLHRLLHNRIDRPICYAHTKPAILIEQRKYHVICWSPRTHCLCSVVSNDCACECVESSVLRQIVDRSTLFTCAAGRYVGTRKPCFAEYIHSIYRRCASSLRSVQLRSLFPRVALPRSAVVRIAHNARMLPHEHVFP